MSALDKFEGFVERLFEKPFAGILGGHLQPVEIAKRLARAMEAEQTLGVDKVFVPNRYQVLLNPAEFEHFAPMQVSLERELSEYLLGVARERYFTLLSRPVVTIEPSEDVGRHGLRILASLTDYVPQSPAPVVTEPLAQHTQKLSVEEVARAAREQATRATLAGITGPLEGATLPVGKSIITIGRALDNDVVIEDARVSRYHAEIRLRGGRFCLRDLQSSNGTVVNGAEVTEIVLQDGDSVQLGDSEFVFHYLAPWEASRG